MGSTCMLLMFRFESFHYWSHSVFQKRKVIDLVLLFILVAFSILRPLICSLILMCLMNGSCWSLVVLFSPSAVDWGSDKAHVCHRAKKKNMLQLAIDNWKNRWDTTLVVLIFLWCSYPNWCAEILNSLPWKLRNFKVLASENRTAPDEFCLMHVFRPPLAWSPFL